MPEARADKRRGGRRVWLRRLGLGVCVMLVLAVALVAALPWWLGTEGGTRWLMERASRVLAPAGLEMERMEWSWMGPTRMRGFVLRDQQGLAAVEADEAVWDRSLWQALFDRPRLGTLRLIAAKLDVERRPDGSLNLVEALAPVLGGGPRTELGLVVEEGTLRVRSPELLEPMEMREVALKLERPAAPETTRFALSGVEARGAETPGTLAIEGDLTRKDEGLGDETLTIGAKLGRWPLAVRDPQSGTDFRCRLEGVLDALEVDGGWTSVGTMTGTDLEIGTTGVGELRGEWDLSVSRVGAVEVRRLIASGVGSTVEASGAFPPLVGRPTVFSADLALAEVSRVVPGLRGPIGDAGLIIEGGRATWRAKAGADGVPEPLIWEFEGEVVDLSARSGEKLVRQKTPARLDARVTQAAGRVTLDTLKIESKAVTASGGGDVDAGIEIKGTIDLEALRLELSELWPASTPAVPGHGEFTARYRRSEAGRYAGGVELLMRDLTRPNAEPAQEEGAVPPPPKPGLERAVPGPPIPGELVVEEQRSDLRLTAELAGNVDAVGWPLDLDTMTADLSGGAVHGVVRARPEDSGRVVTIERFEIGPESSAAGDERPEPWLAVSGTYRVEERVLRLMPLEGSKAAVRLGPEGLVATGIGQADWGGSGDLVFDLEEDSGQASGHIRLEAAAGVADGLIATIRGKGSADSVLMASETGELELGSAAFGWVAALANGGQSGWDLRIGRVELDMEALGVAGTGRVVDLLGSRTLEMEGTFDPRWERLSEQAAERLGPDARIAGELGRFRVAGPLGGGIDAIAGDVSIALSEARAYGMMLGRTPLRFWWGEGAAGIDPIDTTLNGGAMRVVPEVTQSTEDGRLTLHLKEGTALADAEINDEVSHRVLAYVAPVLDQATRVSGRVSASIREASIPLEAGASDEVYVEGAVVFQDVRFAPGPLAYQIYQALNIPPTTLRLDQPVQIAIRDGFIHEQGFSLPLGNVGRIEMAGTVGFDRSLAMTGRVGMAAEQFATVPVFNQIAPALKVDFPIEGTLDDPRIDGKGVAKSMGRMGVDSLKGVGLGSLEALIEAIDRPPPTPEEIAAREEQRARAKAERAARLERQREEQLRKKRERQLRREERRMRRTGGR